MTTWLLLLGMGLITYALRLSMIAALGRIQVPDVVQRGLRFVPPAVLTAIILPELLRPSGAYDITLGNVRLLAGILAILVAWRSRNALLTIAVGMAAFWVLGALL
jgi:branched-subunit amino acid transport protein